MSASAPGTVTKESFRDLVVRAYGLPPGSAIDLSFPLKEDIHWNSFNIVMLMAKIEADYGVLLPEAALWECNSLQEVLDLLLSKISNS